MQTILKTKNGVLKHGDNIEVMKLLKDNTIHSCISDFPYAIEFMNKNWDTSKCWNQGEGKHGTFEGTGYTGKKRPAFYQNSHEDKLIFYDWCYERAKELFRVIRPGGYVLIFGHPKTNHRMKCAFEDVGFNIVEEIDWIYFTGFPKNQDIGKLFDKREGKERTVIGKNPYASRRPNPMNGNVLMMNETKWDCTKDLNITAPASDLAKKWDGWKTSGLKPSKEPITVFQKPLEGTYCDNIEKWDCGGMNIDACRIGVEEHIVHGKEAGKFQPNGGSTIKDYHSISGRFPPNIVFDEEAGKLLDEQSGITKSSGGHGDKSKGALGNKVFGKYDNEELAEHAGGLGDVGGGSRFFYCAKPSNKEKVLIDGTKNPHVTVKPISLYKWLIKLVTPKDGNTIDITAGSGTHGAACEELNKDEGYNLKWLDVELLNTEKEPYCDFAKKRIEEIVNQ